MSVVKELLAQRHTAGRDIVPPDNLVLDVWRAQEDTKGVKPSGMYYHIKCQLSNRWSDFQIMMAMQYIRLTSNPAKLWSYYDSPHGRKDDISPDGDCWDRESEMSEAAWASARRLAAFCKNR